MLAPRFTAALLAAAGLLAAPPLCPGFPGDPPAAAKQAEPAGWPVYRGDPARTNRGAGGLPLVEARWRQPTVRTDPPPDPRRRAPGRENPGQVGQWLDQAVAALRRNNQPVLPALYPITATLTRDGPQAGKPEKVPLLIYRSHWGVHAVHMKDGKPEWEVPSDWSLGRMAADPRKLPALAQWLGFYQNPQLNPRPGMLFENSVVGSLSTDGRFVYAVDDLVVPPPASPGMEFDGRLGGHPGMGRFGPEVTDAIRHSRLMAFDLRTGKLAWQLGDSEEKGPLADCYFLGPPLPLGGKLYAVVEKDHELPDACYLACPMLVGVDLRARNVRELCLARIDPAAARKQAGDKSLWLPRVESVRALTGVRGPLRYDPARRTQAAHPAAAEGVLVCPTNAGAVVGVDLRTGAQAWAYPYREKSDPGDEAAQPGPGRFRGGIDFGPDGQPLNSRGAPPQWKVTAPAIADGKVVFAAPDAKSVHCVSLRDGAPVWSHRRQEDDQYLAGVFAGRVLLVGKKAVRALSLAKGEELWALGTGVPAGQGVASDNVYYLPVRESAQDKEPEICAIDVEKGRILARTKSRLVGGKKEVPGNLLFYEGDVVSQSLTEVVAFPQLKAKLAEIDALIAKNPDDPDGLTERGVLRLDKGDLLDAVDDFRRALAHGPGPKTKARARARLYEALTELFQRDFDKAEARGFLPEYEALCRVDAGADVTGEEQAALREEGRRRRANFLCLVAKGKEAQGKLVEALERYQEFGAAAGAELISVVDEPMVKTAPDVWSRGRVEAMLARATPGQRKPLEDRLAQRWQQIQKAGSTEDLKQFVALFGSGFAVGREAALSLAERLARRGDVLAAELQLLSLRDGGDPASAARAVEALAKLALDERLPADAAHYYRALGRDHAGTAVRGGKTGADLLREAGADKRLLPYLGGPAGFPDDRPFQVVEERGAFAPAGQVYAFEQAGEPLPFFRNHRLALRYDNHQLKLLDRAGGGERWSQSLTRTMFQNLVYGAGRPDAPRFRYQTLGHLAVLPLGHMVFGLDPVGKRVLWERSLLGPHAGPGPPPFTQLLVGPHDGVLQVVYPDGWVQRLSGPLGLGPSALCVQTGAGLEGLDPLTGRTLWTREAVHPRSHVFGDGQNVYVVEMNGQTPSATRALRAYDGVAVPVPDFAALYENRVRVRGRTILASEAAPGGGVTLRLYDVRDGKDLWKQSFAAGATALHSEDPDLAGAVEPGGTVRVFDLRTRKEVLNARLDDPRDLDKVQAVHLLADGRQFYLACNSPVDKAVMPFGGVHSNLTPGTGLRAVPVNGAVYAFRADTGRRVWRQAVPNQMLVLEQFADLPVMLFTARYQRWAKGAIRNVEQATPVLILQKRTGKIVYANDNLPGGTNFHALHVDAGRGRIEFVSYQMKLVVRAKPDAAPPAPAPE